MKLNRLGTFEPLSQWLVNSSERIRKDGAHEEVRQLILPELATFGREFPLMPNDERGRILDVFLVLVFPRLLEVFRCYYLTFGAGTTLSEHIRSTRNLARLDHEVRIAIELVTEYAFTSWNEFERLFEEVRRSFLPPHVDLR